MFKLKPVPLGYTTRRIRELHVCGWKFGYYRVSCPRTVNFAGALSNAVYLIRASSRVSYCFRRANAAFSARPYRDANRKTLDERWDDIGECDEKSAASSSSLFELFDAFRYSRER